MVVALVVLALMLAGALMHRPWVFALALVVSVVSFVV